MENKFKPIKLETTENKPIVFDTQEMFNQEYINDLTNLLKTNNTIPNHTPKKFIDCFYSYFDGISSSELYTYINNKWVTMKGAAGTNGTNGINGTNGVNGKDGQIEYFGDGSDGNVTISTNTNLSRDMYYNNLTINNGVVLNPNGYRIFVSGKTIFLGTGKIARNGNSATNKNGGNGLDDGTIRGSLGGSNGGSGGEYSGGGSNGYAGVNGTGNTNIGAVSGVDGGKGGDAAYSISSRTGGEAGTGGFGNSETASFENVEKITSTSLTLNTENSNYIARVIYVKGSSSDTLLSTPASSGGGGGGATVYNEAVAGDGGGAGGNGGIVYFASKEISTIDGNDFIQVIGGNGANGGNGLNTVPNHSGGGGGGGGGGCGGLAIVIYKTLTGTGNINISGGTGGIGGTAADGNIAAQKNGLNGSNGNDGKYIKIKILDNNI